MKKVALSGNIGCGKSYVANIIKNYGVCVLDCDKIAAQVRNAHSDLLSNMFQMDANDTKLMADVVFSDDLKRKQLEDFLYPKILEELNRNFILYEKETLVVVEVPLLYEKGWETLFDEVWIVACKEATALQRLMKYRHIDESEARRRLAKQMPLNEKIQRADVIIYNEEGEDVKGQIQDLLKKEGVRLC